MAKPDYDITLARVAGNIASGFVSAAPAFTESQRQTIANASTDLAIRIIENARTYKAQDLPELDNLLISRLHGMTREDLLEWISTMYKQQRIPTP